MDNLIVCAEDLSDREKDPAHRPSTISPHTLTLERTRDDVDATVIIERLWKT